MEGGSKVVAVTTRSVHFSPLPFSLPLALLYAFCCSSWVVSSLYLPLKQPWQPLQTFNQKIWPCKRPLLAGKTFPSPKLCGLGAFSRDIKADGI
jgi:hypothetical protein